MKEPIVGILIGLIGTNLLGSRQSASFTIRGSEAGKKGWSEIALFGLQPYHRFKRGVQRKRAFLIYHPYIVLHWIPVILLLREVRRVCCVNLPWHGRKKLSSVFLKYFKQLYTCALLGFSILGTKLATSSAKYFVSFSLCFLLCS